jgi:signal transduction histidine kinase
VIDDERGPRESLRILLKNDFDVHTADSVDAGLKLLTQAEPDVVILDIRMPGKSGIEGLRLIRDIDPHVSVIMLTGYGALETAQEAIRHGANDYLKKPFDAVEMLEAIRRNVERSHWARKRAQAARELEQLNQRLAAELVQKERLASLGQASAEFVHDLRNPLSIVLGYVELLGEELKKVRPASEQPADGTREYVDVIYQNVMRCKELADMWQNLGKRQGAPRQPVPVRSLLRDLARNAQALTAGTSIRVECEPGTPEADVLADSLQLFRAVQNVVSNAIDAVRDRAGGFVRLAGAVQGGQVVLQVADNGCGMTPEQVQKAFEPYFTTKSFHKGTGLGLFITKKVVEDFHGSIQIQSRPDEGTRVIITLPIHQPGAG